VQATVKEKVMSSAIIGVGKRARRRRHGRNVGAAPACDIVILAVLFDSAVSTMILPSRASPYSNLSRARRRISSAAVSSSRCLRSTS
jgi:hypothetical protein